MKNLFKIVIIALLFAFSADVFGQGASQTATATATIVSPIAIAKNVDMNFGNVAVAAGTGGTVVLATNSTRTTGGAGGATLPATAGTVTAAQFTVTGTAGYTFALTMPAGVTVIDDNALHTMDVDTWTTDFVAGTPLIVAGIVIHIGATLHVNAAQTPGVYSSDTPFQVTVNYN